MYHLQNDVGVGSRKKSSKYLSFCINLPKNQMIKNFPNITPLWWIFSQDI